MRPLRSYGGRIYSLRRLKELSQEDLAERAKIDPKSVIQIEKGKRNPTIKTLQKIASALDVSVSDLLKD